MGSAKRKITYKCPFCNNRYYRDNLPSHLQDTHEELIPEDFTALRYTFNYVNKKPLNYHGKCTECGGPTPWDENKGRYDRQCEKKACKDSYLKKFEENMMRTKGVTRISATAAGQEKMLAHRRISGEYTFTDGTKKTYTGKYEKAALEFMDKILHVKSKDIMCPGVILEYQFEGKTHIYITDFYYQPYNLIIEVKDGGDNPNKRSMPSYRAKQIAKEKFIVEHTNFNYIRLTNNELSQLISVFLDLKFQLIENTGDRVIHINEMMNALMGSSPVGYNTPQSTYIVNYMQNNTFSQGITNDPELKCMIYVDPEDHRLKKGSKDNISGQYEMYLVNTDNINESLNIIANTIGSVVRPTFIYETVFGKKMYTDDQIRVTEEAIRIPSFEDHLDSIKENTSNFILYGTTDISTLDRLNMIKNDASYLSSIVERSLS